MPPKMDPPLKEKQSFFEQLDACRDSGDDESDVLSTKEQRLRQKCKAFSLVSAASKPSSRARRTTSDPTPNHATQELDIVVATPRSSPLNAAASISEIPETEQHSCKRIIRGSAHCTARSQSDLEPSPSVSMAKRKRDQPLQMVPVSKRIFEGLHFFYVPNNDVSPIRRIRITKAREHGAIWTADSKIATHIIVDSDMEYEQMAKTLDKISTSPSVILVNDRYPIDCMIRGIVFDPYQTIERYKYKLPEPKPKPVDKEDSSVKTKRRRGAKHAEDTPPSSPQGSSDLIPSSYPEVVRSAKSGAEATGGTYSSGSGDGADHPVFMDDLATCIDAVRDDPEKYEYLDESGPDAQTSEDEGRPKKKGKGCQSTQRNDANINFSQDKFMCMRGGTRDKKPSGPNADTIKLFEEMAEEHRLSNQHWRVQAYRKAIATLRRQTKKITTATQAAALPNIGSSLASHIEEIATTGRFAKLDNDRDDPPRAALKMFCNVYGVGVPTAQRWVEQGYRTLDDLRTNPTLSKNQRLGVEHYDDLLTRIPRAEVKALGDHVKDVAAAIDPNVELIIGGSYRRGAETSGDIDIIVTKDGTFSTRNLSPFLDTLVETLTKEGFLTAALASHRHGGGNKWHGCCVLPEAAFPGPKEDYRPIWRRIDFLLVPNTEIGAALIYFTGNDLFNRSMRLLARKMGMRLNHRFLSGASVFEGRSEKKIFEILGVQWREPHERWC